MNQLSAEACFPAARNWRFNLLLFSARPTAGRNKRTEEASSEESSIRRCKGRCINDVPGIADSLRFIILASSSFRPKIRLRSAAVTPKILLVIRSGTSLDYIITNLQLGESPTSREMGLLRRPNKERWVPEIARYRGQFRGAVAGRPAIVAT